MIQIDRLRAMAREAMAQYQAEIEAGGEPAFPQWAKDIVIVCDCAKAKTPCDIEPIVPTRSLQRLA